MNRQVLGGMFLIGVVAAFMAGYAAGNRPAEMLRNVAGPAEPAWPPAKNPPATSPPARTSPAPAPAEAAPGQRTDVYFSPEGGATDAIVGQIDAARRTIDMQVYSFTSNAISRAILKAHRRGVKVRLVADRNEVRDSHNEAVWLSQQGVPVFVDGRHSIAHNKVIVIDGSVVVTGSFNFTKAAERNNAENVLILHDPTLAATYERNFATHLAHSEPLPAGERPSR